MAQTLMDLVLRLIRLVKREGRLASAGILTAEACNYYQRRFRPGTRTHGEWTLPAGGKTTFKGDSS